MLQSVNSCILTELELVYFTLVAQKVNYPVEDVTCWLVSILSFLDVCPKYADEEDDNFIDDGRGDDNGECVEKLMTNLK